MRTVQYVQVEQGTDIFSGDQVVLLSSSFDSACAIPELKKKKVVTMANRERWISVRYDMNIPSFHCNQMDAGKKLKIRKNKGKGVSIVKKKERTFGSNDP